jgi:hypothetical protein
VVAFLVPTQACVNREWEPGILFRLGIWKLNRDFCNISILQVQLMNENKISLLSLLSLNFFINKKKWSLKMNKTILTREKSRHC